MAPRGRDFCGSLAGGGGAGAWGGGVRGGVVVAPITDLGVRIRFALHVSFTSRASRNPSRARGASSPRRVCVRAALSVGAGAGGGRGASVTAGVGDRLYMYTSLQSKTQSL